MPAVVVAVADAVVARLTSVAYIQPFTPVRRIRPVLELTDATLSVFVLPKSQVVEALARNLDSFDVAVDVAVMKRITHSDSDETDVEDMLALVEQIIDQLRHFDLVLGTEAGAMALFSSIVNNPIYAPEQLDQQRQFTSVATVTYRVVRDVRAA